MRHVLSRKKALKIIVGVLLTAVLFGTQVYAAPVFGASTFTEAYGKNLTGTYSGANPFSRWKTASEYKTNAAFANFRSMTGGSLGKNVIFRSRIPDELKDSSRIADLMMQDAGIKYVINFYETKAALKSKFANAEYNSYYYRKMVRNNRVTAARTLMQFDTRQKLLNNRSAMITGFKTIAAHAGPYLVHCAAGKDRTGFFAVIVEALMGASYNEILNDYLQTYINVGYKCTRATALSFCKKNLDFMLQLITYSPSGSAWNKMDLAKKAERYLKDGGLNSGQIRSIRKHLKKNYPDGTRVKNGNYYFTVKLKDSVTGYVIFTQQVAFGKDAVMPSPPEHDGYEFAGWSSDGKKIKEDCVITANFTKKVSSRRAA